MKNTIKLLSIALFFFFGYNISNANFQSILDEKIHKFCFENDLAKEYQFGKNDGNNGERCKLILQSIYRFETGNLKSYSNNNIFNFRSPTCKKDWIEKYDCKVSSSGFLIFPDVTNSIKFAVDRYYRIDYRKTINQIISGGCYFNIKNQYVCFQGFTHTIEHQKNYTDFVRNYFKKNK